MEALVAHYGYLAVLVGTFLEGETILVLAGFAAHRGWLELPFVLLAAFAGSAAGDQIYFTIGRRRGRAWLERRPRLADRVARVAERLRGRESLLIVSIRFLYGLRVALPFACGAAGIDVRRFLLWNSIGAAIWAVSFGTAGYFFGAGFELLIDDARYYERDAFVALLVAAAVWGIFSLLRRRRTPRGEPRP